MVNEVKRTYEDWGNISKLEEDHNSAVSGGGDQYVVNFTYAKATGGRNTIRRTGVTAGGVTMTYDYGAGSSIADNSSRVYQIKDGSTPLATYSYNGVSQVIRTYLEEPDSFYDLDGASARTYSDLDRFNRTTGSAWTKDLAADKNLYSVTLNYDRDSSITDITDNVQKAGVSGNRNFDVQYSLDNLNRVTKAEEGTFSAGSISNRSRQELWTLTQTGNFDRTKLDINGNNTFTDSGDYDDSRTHNKANELTGRDTDSNGTDNYTLTYDAAGQLTDDGQSYKFVYDAFGRLRKITDRSNALITEYTYNGLGHRVSWKYDNSRSGGGAPDGVTDSNDLTYSFAYDDQWRLLATYRSSDSSPKEVFVYHAAGLGGRGGASGGIGGYIDHVVLRDKDASTAWTSAADGGLDERDYYCQNWRADVCTFLTATGKMIEWGKSAAYGVPYALPAGDTDSDGKWDGADKTNISTSTGYDVRQDAELDGDVDAADSTYADSITGTNQTLGRYVVSSTAVGNRKGFAGYENDGAIIEFYHVRNRVLSSKLGRWLTRDRIHDLRITTLYEYAYDTPLIDNDPSGMQPGRIRWIEPPPPPPPPYADPGFPGHMYERHCGQGYGDNIRDCADIHAPPGTPPPLKERQKCGDNDDQRDDRGFCPPKDCLDAACMKHDQCYYMTCIKFRILPGNKTECQQFCDNQICEDMKNCKGKGGFLSVKWWMKRAFCQWNKSLRKDATQDNCDNQNPDQRKMPSDYDPRVPYFPNKPQGSIVVTFVAGPLPPFISLQFTETPPASAPVQQAGF